MDRQGTIATVLAVASLGFAVGRASLVVGPGEVRAGRLAVEPSFTSLKRLAAYAPLSNAAGRAPGPGAAPTVAASDVLEAAASSCGVRALRNARAEIRATLDLQGHVARVSVVSDLFGGDATEACIVRQLEGLRFATDTDHVVRHAVAIYTP